MDKFIDKFRQKTNRNYNPPEVDQDQYLKRI